LLFNALGPSLHKLPDALRKEGFRLSSEPRMTVAEVHNPQGHFLASNYIHYNTFLRFNKNDYGNTAIFVLSRSGYHQNI
jgi:hypothetical protein